MKKFVKIKEAAAITGLSVYYIRKGCKSETIPYIKSGKTVYIDMDAFLQQLGDNAQNMQMQNKEAKDMQQRPKQAQKNVQEKDLGVPSKINVRVVDEDGQPMAIAFAHDALDEILELSNKKAGKLFIALIKYSMDGTAPDFSDDPVLAEKFEQMKPAVEMTEDELYEYWLSCEDIDATNA